MGGYEGKLLVVVQIRLNVSTDFISHLYSVLRPMLRPIWLS